MQTEIDALTLRNADAVGKLAALQAGATPQAIAEATAARDALKAQIEKLKIAYTAYRAIPHEAGSTAPVPLCRFSNSAPETA